MKRTLKTVNHRGGILSTYETTAKHRKDPEKHSETTPTNNSSKTVAIQ